MEFLSSSCPAYLVILWEDVIYNVYTACTISRYMVKIKVSNLHGARSYTYVCMSNISWVYLQPRRLGVEDRSVPPRQSRRHDEQLAEPANQRRNRHSFVRRRWLVYKCAFEPNRGSSRRLCTSLFTHRSRTPLHFDSLVNNSVLIVSPDARPRGEVSSADRRQEKFWSNPAAQWCSVSFLVTQMNEPDRRFAFLVSSWQCFAVNTSRIMGARQLIKRARVCCWAQWTNSFPATSSAQKPNRSDVTVYRRKIALPVKIKVRFWCTVDKL